MYFSCDLKESAKAKRKRKRWTSSGIVNQLSRGEVMFRSPHATRHRSAFCVKMYHSQNVRNLHWYDVTPAPRLTQMCAGETKPSLLYKLYEITQFTLPKWFRCTTWGRSTAPPPCLSTWLTMPPLMAIKWVVALSLRRLRGILDHNCFNLGCNSRAGIASVAVSEFRVEVWCGDWQSSL